MFCFQKVENRLWFYPFTVERNEQTKYANEIEKFLPPLEESSIGALVCTYWRCLRNLNRAKATAAVSRRWE